MAFKRSWLLDIRTLALHVEDGRVLLQTFSCTQGVGAKGEATRAPASPAWSRDTGVSSLDRALSLGPDGTSVHILKTLEKSHVGGWFPWGYLPSPDCLILWSVPDVCKDVDLDVLVEALRPVGTFKKIGKVFRKEEDSTVGMLQIGEDVDYLLIPREVRLAGGVWRVISKPATKEAEFRERLIQFLQEEGRTLEDVARIIEKSTPHPPQPPKKAKETRVRRVPQMVTPPPRLVVGTYDSSNASDSELSDFETSKVKGNRGSQRTRKVRKMPVSYLGSKFLGSDIESEDDQELIEAFLRRGEKKPSAPPPRRRVNMPVPMFEDNLGPRPSKADRWREYVSQVSWGKLKQRVKGWAPRSGTEVGEAQQASIAAERTGVSRRSHTSRDNSSRNAGDGNDQTLGTRRWKPKMKVDMIFSAFRYPAGASREDPDVREEEPLHCPRETG
ncbi:hypothetical protein STEG23_031720 [Scotinomys teguina]